MKLVKHILEAKGSSVYSVAPEATVFEALQLMAQNEVGALLVMSGDDVQGILSERDYARRVCLEGKSSRELKVKELMSKNVLYVNPEQNMEECMALMSDKHIRHLPVMENDKLVGIISIGDVVKTVISEKNMIIEQLVHYIHGPVPQS